MSTGTSHRLELRVGALILAGIIAVVVIILVSDRISFEGNYRVTAFLKDAGGLHPGSPITLSGLPIGKIVTITTDSPVPNYPVKVVMEVKKTYRLPRSVTLTLATSGIFGDAYLAFSGSGSPGNATDLLPTDGTAKVYASRGFVDTATEGALSLLSAMNDILTPEARADSKRLLAGAADLANEGASLIRHLNEQTQRIDATLANLEALSGSLAKASDRLVPRVEAALIGIELLGVQGAKFAERGEGVMQKADSILARGELLMKESDGDLRSTIADLHRSMADVATLLAAARQGQGVLGQLLMNRDLAKDVNDLTVNLAQVSQLMLEHPEALIFGQSKEQRAKWLEQRDRLRIRRAFQEGWNRTPEGELPKPTLLESGRGHATGE